MTKSEYRHIFQSLTQRGRYEADLLSEDVITDFSDETDPLYERREKRKYIYRLLQERRKTA